VGVVRSKLDYPGKKKVATAVKEIGLIKAKLDVLGL